MKNIDIEKLESKIDVLNEVKETLSAEFKVVNAALNEIKQQGTTEMYWLGRYIEIKKIIAFINDMKQEIEE